MVLSLRRTGNGKEDIPNADSRSGPADGGALAVGTGRGKTFRAAFRPLTGLGSAPETLVTFAILSHPRLGKRTPAIPAFGDKDRTQRSGRLRTRQPEPGERPSFGVGGLGRKSNKSELSSHSTSSGRAHRRFLERQLSEARASSPGIHRRSRAGAPLPCLGGPAGPTTGTIAGGKGVVH
jgi:hypothetical protein